jgi:hypothetical protein
VNKVPSADLHNPGSSNPEEQKLRVFLVLLRKTKEQESSFSEEKEAKRLLFLEL